MFTPRAASKATIESEISDWSIMPSFAQRYNTNVSVGEKAGAYQELQKKHCSAPTSVL